MRGRQTPNDLIEFEWSWHDDLPAEASPKVIAELATAIETALRLLQRSFGDPQEGALAVNLVEAGSGSFYLKFRVVAAALATAASVSQIAGVDVVSMVNPALLAARMANPAPPARKSDPDVRLAIDIGSEALKDPEILAGLAALADKMTTIGPGEITIRIADSPSVVMRQDQLKDASLLMSLSENRLKGKSPPGPSTLVLRMSPVRLKATVGGEPLTLFMAVASDLPNLMHGRHAVPMDRSKAHNLILIWKSKLAVPKEQTFTVQGTLHPSFPDVQPLEAVPVPFRRADGFLVVTGLQRFE